MTTPSDLLDLMADVCNEFVLDGRSHRMAARHDLAGTIAILVVGKQGRLMASSSLPHWKMDRHRGTSAKAQRW